MDEQDSGVTLAELLAAFSLATDLGLGQPMEHLGPGSSPGFVGSLPDDGARSRS